MRHGMGSMGDMVVNYILTYRDAAIVIHHKIFRLHDEEYINKMKTASLVRFIYTLLNVVTI